MGDIVAFDLALFVAATVAAALVAGLAGFAFALVAVPDSADDLERPA